MRILPLLLSLNCSWNYRFDSYYNHFNIVYPDKNAVYFGMIIPSGSSSFRVMSDESHPIATYFSVQVYEIGGVAYHYNDMELLNYSGLTDIKTPYDLQITLTKTQPYVALFRIYDSKLNPENYWAGIPPRTFIDEQEYSPCDIDYDRRDNIMTNVTRDIHPSTGTVCPDNGKFSFISIPQGSLANADANYMIACVKPGNTYTIRFKLPVIMCSLIYGASPTIDEDYEMRYASMSLVSTSTPRPTIYTYKLPCNTTDYTITMDVSEDIILPAFLYRQLLSNTYFEYSIKRAKQFCGAYIHNSNCIRAIMGEYYPEIQITPLHI